jgi:hypothetical protein
MDKTVPDVATAVSESSDGASMMIRAAIDIAAGRFVLREKLSSISLADLQALTGTRLPLSGPVADLNLSEI